MCVFSTDPVYNAQLGIGEKRFEVVPAVIDELKSKAKSLGLWNMCKLEALA